MKSRYPILSLFAVLIFSAATTLNAQEADPNANPVPESFTNIVDRYVDSTVDIEANLTVETGAMSYMPTVVYGTVENHGCVMPAVLRRTQDGGQKITFGGSGAFIDKDGNILTAAHVVKAENDELVFNSLFGSFKARVVDYEYWVVIKSKNRQYRADYIGACVGADYALIRAKELAPDDCKPVAIGKSSGLKVGDPVIAIGTPFGFSGTVTQGIISRLHARINMNYYEDFIQTDAAINPGNSGGPLFNAKGELVGINTAAIVGRSISFAVPIDLVDLETLRKGDIDVPWFGAEALLDQFPRRGKYKKPGIHDLSELYDQTGIEDAQSLMALADLTYYFAPNDPEKPVDFENKWAIIHQVENITKPVGKIAPAKKAGLRKGDLVIKVNGVRIRDGMDLRLALRRVPIDGKPVEIRYIRVTDGVAKEEGCIVILEKKE